MYSVRNNVWTQSYHDLCATVESDPLNIIYSRFEITDGNLCIRSVKLLYTKCSIIVIRFPRDPKPRVKNLLAEKQNKKQLSSGHLAAVICQARLFIVESF